MEFVNLITNCLLRIPGLNRRVELSEARIRPYIVTFLLGTRRVYQHCTCFLIGIDFHQIQFPNSRNFLQKVNLNPKFRKLNALLPILGVNKANKASTKTR